MPELPEVETVRSQLKKHVVGETIRIVEIKRPKIVSVFDEDAALSIPPEVETPQAVKKLLILQKVIPKLLDSSITNVRRFSKLLVIDLSSDYSVAIHLKMTGRVILEDIHHPEYRSEWEFEYRNHPHTHLIVEFESGSRLFFNDYRRFGTIQIVRSKDLPSLSYIKNLGKEFFTDLTSKEFYKSLQSTSRAIKIVLLDQKKMAGVGNIYANEALWRAKIHPELPAKKLSPKQSDTLFNNLETVMKKSIQRQGATSENFRDLFGRKGTAQNYFDVYNQEGKPCKQCGATVEKYFLGGRGTYLCKKCQK